MQSRPNPKVSFNEFVANALRDNIGSKKSAFNLRKKDEVVFSFEYQNFGVRVNHTITQTINAIKRNDFDLVFCIKMPPHFEF